MPQSCSAFGCSNNSERCYNMGISFHRFPLNNKILMQRWLLNIRRQNFIPNEYTKICSEHFEKKCFKYQTFTNRRELKKEAVPTKFCFIRERKRTSNNVCENDSDSDSSEEMVNSCSAFGCTERYKKGNQIGFFRFPKDALRRFLWIKAMRRHNWQPSETTVICGKHFQTGRPTYDENHPDYVPNIFVFSKYRRSSSTMAEKVLYKIEPIPVGTSSKGITHSADSNESSLVDEPAKVNISVTREHSQTGAPSLLRDISNPDWAPSINLGHDYFENEVGGMKIYQENLQSVAENCASCMQISDIKDDDDEEEDDDDLELVYAEEEEEDDDDDDDDDDEEEENEQKFSVFNESKNVDEEDITSHENNEGGQDRLKYFIFSGSSNASQTCGVTHGEALNAAETLLRYMENQDNVDHADLILIRGYRRKILDNMKKKG